MATPPLVRYLAPSLAAQALEEGLAPAGALATGTVATPYGEAVPGAEFDPGEFLLEARADAAKAGVVEADDSRVIQEQVGNVDSAIAETTRMLRQLATLQAPPRRKGWGAALERFLDPYHERAEAFRYQKLKFDAMAEGFRALSQLYQERRLLVAPTPFEEQLEQEAAELSAKAALRQQRDGEILRLKKLGLKLTPQQELKFRENGTFEEGPTLATMVAQAASLGEAGVLPPSTGDLETDAILQDAAARSFSTKERRRAEDIQAQVQNRYIPGPFEGFQTKQQLLGAIEEETEKRWKDPGNIRKEARPVIDPATGEQVLRPLTGTAAVLGAAGLAAQREPLVQTVNVPIRDRADIRSEVIKELFPGAVQWFPEYVQEDLAPPPASPAGAERTKKPGG